jgi:hypothetical protein
MSWPEGQYLGLRAFCNVNFDRSLATRAFLVDRPNSRTATCSWRLRVASAPNERRAHAVIRRKRAGWAVGTAMWSGHSGTPPAAPRGGCHRTGRLRMREGRAGGSGSVSDGEAVNGGDVITNEGGTRRPAKTVEVMEARVDTTALVRETTDMKLLVAAARRRGYESVSNAFCSFLGAAHGRGTRPRPAMHLTCQNCEVSNFLGRGGS